jgi:hypothetical protein
LVFDFSDTREALVQGDQIGRILAHWVGFYFGQVFKNYIRSPHFGLLLCVVKALNYFRQKVGWALFWAIFSQTHLVTLLSLDSESRLEG